MGKYSKQNELLSKGSSREGIVLESSDWNLEGTYLSFRRELNRVGMSADDPLLVGDFGLRNRTDWWRVLKAEGSGVAAQSSTYFFRTVQHITLADTRLFNGKGARATWNLGPKRH